MNAAARQTRAVYDALRTYDWPYNRPIDWLRRDQAQRMANAMWRTLGHRHADLVVHVACIECSWADLDTGEVVLAMHQRELITLSHEVAHLDVGWADEGLGSHGPIFLERWQLLLARHVGVDPYEFEWIMTSYGATIAAHLEDHHDHSPATVRTRGSLGARPSLVHASGARPRSRPGR